MGTWRERRRGAAASGSSGMAALPFAFALLAPALALGCDDAPDEAALDRMLAEARAAEEVAQREHAAEDESASWTLTVLGETALARPETLTYAEIGALEATEVEARPPLEGAVAARFTGPALRTILGHVGGAAAGVTELTLVASDGFRATIELEDVTGYPILLATGRDGERLERELGGPLLAVFPLGTYPHLAERYTESWWVYYVTHVVVGTEPAHVRVGTSTVTREVLASLPTRTITASVGYRVGWPSEPVAITGPTLAAVLAAAGADLSGATSVRVLGHAPITRSAERPTRVAIADVASGDAILGLAYGDPPEPIPARLGGSVVLCFTDAVAARQNDHDWLTFVDELAVERAAAGTTDAEIAPTSGEPAAAVPAEAP